MKAMTWRGYTARIQVDVEDQLLWGTVADIEHGISFHGQTVAELEVAFREAVDDYLEWCDEQGVEPQRPPALSGAA